MRGQVMIKNPLHEDFIFSENSFYLAHEFWKELISEASPYDNPNDNVKFHNDGNPIYYNHFQDLKKSLRIIQEPFERDLPVHFGAWIETASDHRKFDELVISVELSNMTLTAVKKLVYIWLHPSLGHKVDEVFLENYIYKSVEIPRNILGLSP